MEKIHISVKNDFNRCPGLRTHDITPGNSGEDFYHQLLNQKFYDAIVGNTILIVDLDDTAGYSPSFIDESFGRLTYDFGKKLIDAHLEIKSDEELLWKPTIFDSVVLKWQKRRENSESPTISSGFSPTPWWHLTTSESFIQISSYHGD